MNEERQRRIAAVTHELLTGALEDVQRYMPQGEKVTPLSERALLDALDSIAKSLALLTNKMDELITVVEIVAHVLERAHPEKPDGHEGWG